MDGLGEHLICCIALKLDISARASLTDCTSFFRASLQQNPLLWAHISNCAGLQPQNLLRSLARSQGRVVCMALEG